MVHRLNKTTAKSDFFTANIYNSKLRNCEKVVVFTLPSYCNLFGESWGLTFSYTIIAWTTIITLNKGLVFAGYKYKVFKARYLHSTILYAYRWGTGMIASSSTFRPHLGRDSRDLFRLLHAVRHGTEALVYSNHRFLFRKNNKVLKMTHPKSLLVSGHKLLADCQWHTLVPPLNSGSNAALASVRALV